MFVFQVQNAPLQNVAQVKADLAQIAAGNISKLTSENALSYFVAASKHNAAAAVVIADNHWEMLLSKYGQHQQLTEAWNSLCTNEKYGDYFKNEIYARRTDLGSSMGFLSALFSGVDAYFRDAHRRANAPSDFTASGLLSDMQKPSRWIGSVVDVLTFLPYSLVYNVEQLFADKGDSSKLPFSYRTAMSLGLSALGFPPPEAGLVIPPYGRMLEDAEMAARKALFYDDKGRERSLSGTAAAAGVGLVKFGWETLGSIGAPLVGQLSEDTARFLAFSTKSAYLEYLDARAMVFGYEQKVEETDPKTNEKTTKTVWISGNPTPQNVENASLAYYAFWLDFGIGCTIVGGMAANVAKKSAIGLVFERARVQLVRKGMKEGLGAQEAVSLAEKTMKQIRAEYDAALKAPKTEMSRGDKSVKEWLKAKQDAAVANRIVEADVPGTIEEVGKFISKRAGIVVQVPGVSQTAAYTVERAGQIAMAPIRASWRFGRRSVEKPVEEMFALIGKKNGGDLYREFRAEAISELKRNGRQVMSDAEVKKQFGKVDASKTRYRMSGREAKKAVDEKLGEAAKTYNHALAEEFNSAYSGAGLKISEAAKYPAKNLGEPPAKLVSEMKAKLEEYYLKHPDKMAFKNAKVQADAEVNNLVIQTLDKKLAEVNSALSSAPRVFIKPIYKRWLKYEQVHLERTLLGFSPSASSRLDAVMDEVLAIDAGASATGATAKTAVTLAEVRNASVQAFKDLFVTSLKKGDAQKTLDRWRERVKNSRQKLVEEQKLAAAEKENFFESNVVKTETGKKLEDLNKQLRDATISKQSGIQSQLNEEWGKFYKTPEGKKYLQLEKRYAELNEAIASLDRAGDLELATRRAILFKYIQTNYRELATRSFSKEAPKWLLKFDEFLTKNNLKRQFRELSGKLDAAGVQFDKMDAQLVAEFRKYCESQGASFEKYDNSLVMGFIDKNVKEAATGNAQARAMVKAFEDHYNVALLQHNYRLQMAGIIMEGLAAVEATGAALYFAGLPEIITMLFESPAVLAASAADFWVMNKYVALAAANPALFLSPAIPLGREITESASQTGSAANAFMEGKKYPDEIKILETVPVKQDTVQQPVIQDTSKATSDTLVAAKQDSLASVQAAPKFTDADFAKALGMQESEMGQLGEGERELLVKIMSDTTGAGEKVMAGIRKSGDVMGMLRSLLPYKDLMTVEQLATTF